MNHIKYRADIDGLRALAVLSVFIFHINSSWLPGGFLGVDIFFVISGYLITSIIHRELQREKFSVLNFYTRRIKRILPAFTLVLLVTMLVGSFVLLPADLILLGDSALSAVFFGSNIFFSLTQGYFLPSSEEWPLLHTWSLAVEEQYYVVWPTLMMLMYVSFRNYSNKVLAVTLFLIIASFAWASFLAMGENSKDAAYYWLPSRAGELLIGSFLALYERRDRYNQLASIVGAILVAASLVFINEHSVFPGYNAIWPCVGVALIIYGGFSPESAVNKLLSLRLFVWIGLISYSLYLWHWPVLAYYRYITMESEIPLSAVAPIVGITFLCAWLSQKYVETPVRTSGTAFRGSLILFFVLPVICFAAWFYLIRGTGGQLYHAYKHEPYSLPNDAEICHDNIDNNCVKGVQGDKQNALLFGDSHAGHYTHFIDAVALHQGWSVYAATGSGCSGFITYLNRDERNIGGYCPGYSDWVVENLAQYDNIFYALRWDNIFFVNGGDKYLEQKKALIDRFLGKLVADGKKVFLFNQVPSFEKNIARRLFIKSRLGDLMSLENEHTTLYLEANRILEELAANYDQVFVVDTVPFTASWSNGLSADGEPVYSDDNHLNKTGARVLAAHAIESGDLSWLKTELGLEDHHASLEQDNPTVVVHKE
jgi:peptidoglycan/LPS O-acetylase OafA/YrhL